MKRIFFIGSRLNVYKSIDTSKYEIVCLFVVKNSYLHKLSIEKNLKHYIIEDKESLINYILSIDFDILISNGCPYILPISYLKKQKEQIFINIHPALLPEIKGKHPINASILYNINIGATCHIMNDDIDSGDIISRVEFPITEDLELGLIYNLSFELEKEVFKIAENRGFKIDINLNKSLKDKKSIYFTRNLFNNKIAISNDNIDLIMRKIRAFNIEGQNAYFVFKDMRFEVKECSIITNKKFIDYVSNYRNNQVIYKYDKNLVVKKDEYVILFKYISGDLDKIKENDILN